jgi:hypothetical protein
MTVVNVVAEAGGREMVGEKGEIRKPPEAHVAERAYRYKMPV